MKKILSILFCLFTLAGMAQDKMRVPGGSTPDDYDNLSLLRRMGATHLAQSFSITDIASTQALNDGRTHWAVIEVKQKITVTGIRWVQAISGDYTADGYNGIALARDSAGQAVKIVETTNDGNIWKGAASSGQEKAFASTATLTPGIYYVGFLRNSSAEVAAPTIATKASIGSSAGALFFTNNRRISVTITGQASIPATQDLSTGSNSSSWPWFAFY